MKITTAWAKEENDTPTLLSVYNEYAQDTWQEEVPEYHILAVGRAKNDGLEIRELVIEIPDSAVTKLFRVPTVAGQVAET